MRRRDSNQPYEQIAMPDGWKIDRNGTIMGLHRSRQQPSYLIEAKMSPELAGDSDWPWILLLKPEQLDLLAEIDELLTGGATNPLSGLLRSGAAVKTLACQVKEQIKDMRTKIVKLMGCSSSYTARAQ
jgi:hypothetical protein